MPKESKKRGTSKLFLVLLLSFLMLPIVTSAILYISNENFKYSANEILGVLPGSVGSFFSNQPTREEREELKNEIARHYIDLTDDRLVDKLLLIKGEDIRLYNDLLVQLNRLNSKKMSRVKEGIRKKEIKGDILIQAAEEIDLERSRKIDALTNYYMSLYLKDGVIEIQRAFERNEVTSEELALVFERLPLETSSRLLTIMNKELSDKIKHFLSISVRRDIDMKISENIYREKELIRLAKIFEVKPINELLSEIAGEEKFNINELAIIYSNLSYKKAGEILARVEDQEFLLRLYDSIDRYEDFNSITDNRSIALAKTTQIIKNYNDKVVELSNIYQRMSRQELAKIVEQMMRSSEVVIRYEIGGGSETIIYTQQNLIIDVLKRFRTNIITEIMQQLDTRRAAELSRKLVE